MANFPPLKNYILYCLDNLIEEYNLSSPFLDVGCGIGDVTLHLARKGWYGKAIDFSSAAIKEAKSNLATFQSIEVLNKSLLQESGIFNTVLLMDVLEHIDDDRFALKKVYSLLRPYGYLVISVPTNKREWRCDDNIYCHLRRYTYQEIRKKLIEAKFKPLLFWDFTYPLFWFMRRIYTKLKYASPNVKVDKFVFASDSSLINAWDIPILSTVLSKKNAFWNLIYKIQFKYFKDKLNNGHEMIVLARKT